LALTGRHPPCEFQSTRPYGARRRASPGFACLDAVSIHAPVWGATPNAPTLLLATRFQSTRPYGARHAVLGLRPGLPRVSIHAPVWGATTVTVLDALDTCVSIHAPVWGATLPGIIYVLCAVVSIHAPVWGATDAEQYVFHRFSRFNPRARMGRDPPSDSSASPSRPFQSTRPYGARQADRAQFTLQTLFQSTRPYGARRASGVISSVIKSFNPRARMGRDGRLAPSALRRPVSIHAPVWGATAGGLLQARDRQVSIHAPVWGATRGGAGI